MSSGSDAILELVETKRDRLQVGQYRAVVGLHRGSRGRLRYGVSAFPTSAHDKAMLAPDRFFCLLFLSVVASSQQMKPVTKEHAKSDSIHASALFTWHSDGRPFR